MLKQVSCLGALVVILTGCVNDHEATINKDLGNAVRHNIALQTINPAAGGPDESQSLDGQRILESIDRMRNRTAEADDSTLIQDVGSSQ
ncbi:MAG: hypothetical protein JKY98_06480 [Gammaproteobacteria bacterium]|nr:hypothetical protein [Gammaproteobacteria bacterium]